MATRSIFTTALPIAQLPWLAPACAPCWIGWMPMEVASAGSERRIYDTAVSDLSVFLRVPSPPTQRCVHHQETNVSGLLEVWPGIRVFLGADARHTVERCR